MNHLRELIEADPAKVFPSCIALNAEAAAAAATSMKEAESAICFHMGDLLQVHQLAVIADLCRLPFDHCWFEAHLPIGHELAGRIVGILCSEAAGEFGCLVFWRVPDIGWVWMGSASGSLREGAFRRWSVEGLDIRLIEEIIWSLRAFLSALHCSNVYRVEHAPSPKLQKARAKRGKAPLFSYWTLRLNGKSERGEGHVGTHTSPRVHLRRGHPRQYAPGKWTWVQACAVGNRAAGVVHKDYQAGPQLLAPVQ